MSTTQTTEITLNEDVQNFLSGFSDLQASMAHLSIPEQRQQIKEMFSMPKEQLEPVKSVEDTTHFPQIGFGGK